LFPAETNACKDISMKPEPQIPNILLQLQLMNEYKDLQHNGMIAYTQYVGTKKQNKPFPQRLHWDLRAKFTLPHLNKAIKITPECVNITKYEKTHTNLQTIFLAKITNIHNWW
jgi:hypothetical protein